MSQSAYKISFSPPSEILPSLWESVYSVGGGFSVYLKFAVLLTWQLAELEKMETYSDWMTEVQRVNNYFRLSTEVSIQVGGKSIDYPDWLKNFFPDNSILMTVQEHRWELTVKLPLGENPSNPKMIFPLKWKDLHSDLLEYLNQQISREQETNNLRNELLLTNQGIVALVEEMEGYYRGGSKEGKELPFDDRVKENRVLIERIREKELALQQAGRLASIGQLVAGVAHEINNPLTFIRMNTELICRFHDMLKNEERTSSEDLFLQLDSSSKAILSGVERISSIVAGLRYFSRQQAIERKEVNLTEVINSAWMLISSDRAVTSGITLDYQDGANSYVCGSYQQLEQVFVNFLQNASRAIKKAKETKGRIRISIHEENSKQGWVIIEIKDNGCGIESSDIPHIFEPFYSKDPKGMGLGLSIVHGIIKEHGGYIGVASELRKGTTITVRLPRYHSETL